MSKVLNEDEKSRETAKGTVNAKTLRQGHGWCI